MISLHKVHEQLHTYVSGQTEIPFSTSAELAKHFKAPLTY